MARTSSGQIFLLLLFSSLSANCGHIFYNSNSGLIVEPNGEFKLLAGTGVKLEGKFVLDNEEELVQQRCGSSLCLLTSGSRKEVKIRVDDTSGECFTITLSSPISTCFEYGEHQWYGGAERWLQAWPIQDHEINSEPFVTMEENWQAVVESYWLTSAGASIYVPSSVPLFTDSNHLLPRTLCMYASNTAPYSSQQNQTLVYDLCGFDDPVQAHKFAINNYLGHAKESPDIRMSRYPIWSTWARYKAHINQSVILDFAQQILDNNFSNSQIEIDDRWEVCYGSLEIDRNSFPNMAELTSELKEKGFRVTMWVHPFINEDCQPWYETAVGEGRLAVSETGSAKTSWWNGAAGFVDFSNTTTKDWYKSRLAALQTDAGIGSFKFDAGESAFLPQIAQFDDEHQYPDSYIKHYVDMAREFGNFIEVRVARETQDRGVFVRMLDKHTRWGLDNGLKALITSMFQMNIAGYSYVLPDMIGGNVYGNDKISKELFIRWLQANILMPTIQFSIAPWDFDEETIKISQDMLALREKYFSYIEDAITEHTISGAPINPPIWYIDPYSEDALKCNDEYLVQDKLLVAPVLQDGGRSRDIYLPSGNWRDVNGDGTLIEGNTWLRDYQVPLDQVPIFERSV